MWVRPKCRRPTTGANGSPTVQDPPARGRTTPKGLSLFGAWSTDAGHFKVAGCTLDVRAASFHDEDRKRSWRCKDAGRGPAAVRPEQRTAHWDRVLDAQMAFVLAAFQGDTCPKSPW